MKECTVCKRELPVTEYYTHTTSKDKLSPSCRDCQCNYQRKRAYGLEHETFLEMIREQDNKCKICDEVFEYNRDKRKGPYVDHCHDSLNIRGLLCNTCNRGLGFFQDNLKVVLRAAEYLRDNEALYKAK